MRVCVCAPECVRSLLCAYFVYGGDAHVYGGDAHVYGGDAHVYGDDAHVYGDDAHVYGGDAHVYGGDAHVYGGDAHVYGDDAHVYGGDAHVYGGDAQVPIAGYSMVGHSGWGEDTRAWQSRLESMIVLCVGIYEGVVSAKTTLEHGTCVHHVPTEYVTQQNVSVFTLTRSQCI